MGEYTNKTRNEKKQRRANIARLLAVIGVLWMLAAFLMEAA